MKSTLLALFFVGILPLYGVKPISTLNRTNPTRIIAEQKHIEDVLKWHKIYQIATIAGACASVGLVGYKAYTSLHQPNDEIANTGTAGSGSNASMGEINVEALNFFLQYQNPKILEEIATKNHGWFMAQVYWLKQLLFNQVNSTIYTVAGIVIANILNNSLGPVSKYIVRLDGLLDRSVSALFHKNNLQWFVTNHVNLVDLFEKLVYYAAVLEGRSVTIPATLLTQNPITVDNTQNTIQSTDALLDFIAYWNIYIQHIESVLGFMHYKGFSHQIRLEGERMIAISSRIQDLINNFAQHVEEKIITAQNNNTKIVLHDELQRLRAQLGFEMDSFCLIDSSKKNEIPHGNQIQL